MSRIARVIVPDVPHHVTQRGNRRQRTFFSVDDYNAYLSFLAVNAKAFGFEVWSYCLMPNHVHLLVVPRSPESLREGIAQTHATYTRLVNRTHNWQGHLWQGRFFSCPVAPDRAAVVARYVELNPVRAGLCAHPRKYRWSSAEDHCSGNAGRFGLSPLSSQIGDWETFLCCDAARDQKEIDGLRQNSTSGRPFGDQAFVERLEATLGRKLSPGKRGPRPISRTVERE